MSIIQEALRRKQAEQQQNGPPPRPLPPTLMRPQEPELEPPPLPESRPAAPAPARRRTSTLLVVLLLASGSAAAWYFGIRGGGFKKLQDRFPGLGAIRPAAGAKPPALPAPALSPDGAPRSDLGRAVRQAVAAAAGERERVESGTGETGIRPLESVPAPAPVPPEIVAPKPVPATDTGVVAVAAVEAATVVPKPEKPSGGGLAGFFSGMTGGGDDGAKHPVRWPKLQLKGLLAPQGSTKGAALINDQIVAVGESIKGALVIEIREGEVVLELEGERRILRTGQGIQ